MLTPTCAQRVVNRLVHAVRDAGEHCPSGTEENRDHHEERHDPDKGDGLFLLRSGQSDADRQHDALRNGDQESHKECGNVRQR